MALIDPRREQTTVTWVPGEWITVTPHDSNALADGSDTIIAKVLYVGGTGNVEVITAGGNTVVFNSVPAGGYIYGFFTHVKSGNTTATNIRAGY